MKTARTESTAQFQDRFLQRTALGVLSLAVAYVLAASQFLVSDTSAAILDLGETVFALLAMVIVLPTFIQFLRRRASGEAGCSDPDGYMGEIFKKACVRTFTVSFIFLMILEPLSSKYFLLLPTNFFINVALAIMLGVFSLTFLFLNRDDDGDKDEDDWEEGKDQPQ